ncbi:Protein of unknown function DUF928 [Trichormus variabilis ATCC 29413]|uniref:DUF928 domain-containing protein n=2 Tax=Anabaena variabilis TaxID=264691 RepID=Q3M5K3_TRIV2|nr:MULTISPECIES: DUF928 domain-containing protein [Nostocaceae]ABA23733.1 Protein of unknown function DUF928 [Trichormus variabilis ATCC 29413]MBC1213541.1 DUF928 domain-containing protein [Trichormus variabilis ARAD]MBC1265835.1 DUF928 domain-containing protein [Trichormus variabilis FSR]MBC1300381.1 DUF928 domain-containing protein [Trichormus variabilis N2B]MBC1310584.1 DUF928 domain-containing protein [Trichormus variabilis PNB]
MARENKYLFQPKLLVILWLISLSSIPIGMTPSMGQVTFRPPKAQAPKKSIGGASRDASSCGADVSATIQASVTPLLPKTNIGLTVAERPTIFVYVPQTNAKTALFALQDERGKQSYQRILHLSKKPGVIEIKLPSSVSALKIGQNYQWSLVMICTEELEPDSPWVSGWIRRVESHRNLSHQPTVQLASKLANMGIWYDSLATLAELKRKQPNNPTVTTSWQELLRSVDLSAIAEVPLAN